MAGLTLERPIERHTGTPPTIAVGLLAGSALMFAADRAPEQRDRDDATWVDGLLLGVAQACALVPGVSRNGATLSAARLRRFRRPAASQLSRHVALPVIVGATWLKGARLARRGIPRELRAPFAAGTAASFASTLASAWIVGRVDRGHRLAPYAAYRKALALAVLARTTRETSRDTPR